MNIWNKIKNLDKNFSWSFMGFLVGIIGIAFAVDTIYFYQEKPNIEYYQLTNTSVLDLKENVTKLDVIYDSTSIKKNRQSLRVVTIKILNSGNEDLGPQHYDKTVPLGLKIKGGVIVETPQIIETSNAYISDRLKINWLSENEISFYLDMHYADVVDTNIEEIKKIDDVIIIPHYCKHIYVHK